MSTFKIPAPVLFPHGAAGGPPPGGSGDSPPSSPARGPDFLPGDRIRLVRLDDPYTRLRPGDEGTVRAVYRSSLLRETHIHIEWDDGSQLSIIPEAGDVIAKEGQ